MPLNDTERLVVQTIRMRLNGPNSLKYLLNNGIDITIGHYYRVKGKLEAEKLKRLHEIGQYGFVDQHLERIDNLELIQQLMWENYWKENSPYKKVMILKELAAVQPYLSAYYEATKEVIKNRPKEKTIDISSLGKQEQEPTSTST